MWSQDKIVHHSDGVGIHILSTNIKPESSTIVFLPGISGIAEGASCLEPCAKQGFNVASMSFRGRGKSSTPTTGYALSDHVRDLDLVLKTLDASKVVLVANSISTIYAAQYLLTTKPNPVVGLVIVDHPLRVRKLREGWAEEFSQFTVLGEPVLNTMRRIALNEIEKESEALDLYQTYGDLGLPTLVMAPSIGKGLLTELDLTYFKRQKATRIINFENSDHFVRLREPEKYVLEISLFAAALQGERHV